MKKVITMVLCDRPEYTRRVLRALSQCHGVGDYLILPQIEPGNEAVIELAQAIDFAETRVTVNPRRYGIARNTYSAWAAGFRAADFIVHLEDDTVPAPDCLRYMEHCRAAYRRDPAIFSVTAYHRYPCPAEHFFSIASRPRYTCWLVGLWRDRWEWARRQWSSESHTYAIPLSRRVRRHRLREIYPLLSRAQNIGARDGVHLKTPEWHRRHQHTKFWAGNRNLKPRRFTEVEDPMVSAVLITAGDADLRPALDSFARQTHVHKELLIVSHGRKAVGPFEDPRMREIQVEKKRGATEASMCNLAIDQAEGDWIVWWDETGADDKARIAAQMTARKPGRPAVLKHQTRLDPSGRRRTVSMEHGIPATALFPRKAGLSVPNNAADPQRELLVHFPRSIVLDNDPALHVSAARSGVQTSSRFGGPRPPLVTAVMITGMHEARYALARVAIDCFRAQSYRNRELLIINHGPVSLDTGEPWLRELRVRKSPRDTVGDLRNFAITEARGEFVMTWDDDDWHGPRRMEIQMAARRPGAAVVLQNQIRYNLLNRSGFYETVPSGIPGTILHPRHVDFEYRSLRRGSDTFFLNAFRQIVVLDNDPSLYLRFYHGLNLWDAAHVMRHLADRSRQDVLEVSRPDRHVINRVLHRHPAYRRIARSVARTILHH
jgi:hypothetical protein